MEATRKALRKYSPEWREVIRRRAVGDTNAKIAQDLRLGKQAVAICLASPEAKAHIAKLMDDIDAEFVKAQALAPFAVLLAGQKRRRTPRPSA